MTIQINGSGLGDVSVFYGQTVSFTLADTTLATQLLWEILPPVYSDGTQVDAATNWVGWIFSNGILAKTQTLTYPAVTGKPDVFHSYTVRCKESRAGVPDPIIHSAIMRVKHPRTGTARPAAGENVEADPIRGWWNVELANHEALLNAQKGYIRVYNATGSTLPALRVCKFTDATDVRTIGGNTNPGGASTKEDKIFNVALADPAEKRAQRLQYCVLPVAVANGAFGWAVTTGGELEGQFSGFTTNRQVFCGAAGVMSNVPVGKTCIEIGTCVNATSTGRIVVNFIVHRDGADTEPSWFGADEDATTDDSSALIQAIAYAKTYRKNKTVRIAAQLGILSGSITLDSGVTLSIEDGATLTGSGMSTIVINSRIKAPYLPDGSRLVKNETSGTLAAGTVCAIVGKNGTVDIIEPFNPAVLSAGFVQLVYLPAAIPAKALGEGVLNGPIEINTTGHIAKAMVWVSATSTIVGEPNSFPYPCGYTITVGSSGKVAFQGGLGRPLAITPEMFGAVGNATGDQSIPLQRWINTGLREDVWCEGLGTYLHNSTLYIDPAMAGHPPNSFIRCCWNVRGPGQIVFNFNDVSYGGNLRLIKVGAGPQIVRRITSNAYNYVSARVNAQGIAFGRRDSSAGHGWVDQDLRDVGGEPLTPAMPQFRDVSFYGHTGVLKTLTITNITTLSDGRALITVSTPHGFRMFDYISIEGVGGATLLNEYCGFVHDIPTTTTFTVAMQPNAAYTSGGTVEVYSCGFTVDQPFTHTTGGASEGYVYSDWSGVYFQACAVSAVLGTNWNSYFRAVRNDGCTFCGQVCLVSSEYKSTLIQSSTRFTSAHTKIHGIIITPAFSAVVDMAHLEAPTLPYAIDVRAFRNLSSSNQGGELLISNTRRGGSPLRVRCVAQPNQLTGASTGDVHKVRLINFPQAEVEYAQWKQDLGSVGFANTESDDYASAIFNVGAASAYTTGTVRCAVKVWKGKTLYENKDGFGLVVPVFGPGSEFTFSVEPPALAAGATWDGAAVIPETTSVLHDTDIWVYDLPSNWPAGLCISFQPFSINRIYVKGVNASSAAYAGGVSYSVRFYFIRRPHHSV